jgi:chemotaxis protein CheD
VSAGEHMARMGEFVASATPGDVLVSLGLGSCIGLALLDRRQAVCGLAHVVLPHGDAARADTPGKWANTAVPALIERIRGLGGGQRLEAVLVGGASMFAGATGGLEVGQRNEAAVREELKARRIPVVAHDTGGSRGRTIRVAVDSGLVTVRAAGSPETPLWPAAARGRRRAA